MKRVIMVILVLVVATHGTALAEGRNGGMAASYVSPSGDFENIVDNGLGFAAIFDYDMANVVDISGSLGWYRFGGVTLNEGTNAKTDSMTMWAFAAGPQVDFGKLYLGLEGAYYTNVDEWGLVPNAGLRKGMVDLSVRYKMTEDSNFYAVRAGLFF